MLTCVSGGGGGLNYQLVSTSTIYLLSYTVLVPQMTGDDLPEGDVIENVSKILHIDIVFNNIILSVK